MRITSIIIIAAFLCFTNCTNSGKSKEKTQQKNELGFESDQIADSLIFLWSNCPADITGDGLADLVYIQNNASGGYVAYREGQTKPGIWKEHIIATAPPDSGLFAAGDMECADMDGDGDLDVFAVRHPGEWTDAGASADLFWYENPKWQVHYIGRIPDALKDVNLTDFDNDGLTDVAALTFDTHSLSIFKQLPNGDFNKAQYWENFMNLHEGMNVGDVNGDGWMDIVACAIVFTNPGNDISKDWKVTSLNEKWNNQTGDWSRNATKAFLQDLDGDGKAEIFVSHSERAGYPVVYYQLNNNGEYIEHTIADNIPACHTLQVFDFDLDGDYDVLAGVNRGRAVNLNKKVFNFTIFLSSENYSKWTPYVIDSTGIYNGQAIDFEGDGDIDIFRYPDHESKVYYLLKNKTIID